MQLSSCQDLMQKIKNLLYLETGKKDVYAGYRSVTGTYFFHSTGFTLLANSSYKTDNIQFIGLIPDTDDYSFIENNKFNGITCLLSHKPDNAAYLQNAGILNYNLSLCGHTHGGQIRIPGFGAIVTSSKYWKLFEYGHYYNKKKYSNLIVSSGLGYTRIKRRLFCKSEIVLIEFI